MPIIYSSKPLKKRDPHDHYPTPKEVCDLMVSLALPTAKKILDPGCGTGIFGRSAREQWPDAVIGGVDMYDYPDPAGNMESYNLVVKEDYLTYQPDEKYDLIIGNPPYRVAQQFIMHSRDLLASADAQLMFLLRLSFLESAKRFNNLWPVYRPHTVVVCSNRPSFTGDNHSDATAYGIFIWSGESATRTEVQWAVWEPARMILL